MDEPKLRSGFPGDRSQAAAEKLRALRERANQALEEHRGRVGEIETQLSDRVRQLAEEFAAGSIAGPDRRSGPPADSPPVEVEAELEALRRQVAEGEAKHARFVEQLTAARRQLEAIESQPCVKCQHADARLAAAEEEAIRLREQLEESLREHEADRTRHEKFVEQLAAARQAINVLQHAAGESAAELRGELDTVRNAKSAVDEQLAAAQRDLAALHSECDAALARTAAVEEELAFERAEFARVEARVASLDTVRGATDDERASLREQVASLSAALAEANTSAEELAQSQAQWKAEKADLAHSLAMAEEALTDMRASSQSEQQGLAGLLAAAEADLQASQQQLAACESEKLTLSLSLSQAESVAQEIKKRLAAKEQLDAQRIEAARGASDESAQLRAELEKAHAAAADRAKSVAELAATLDEARRELTSLRDSMASKADLETARRECQAAEAAITQLQIAAATHQKELAAARADAAAAHAAASAEAEAAREAAIASQAAIQAAEANVQALRAASAAELDALQKASRPAAEFADLQQKFDLALADVQKLKRECSSLREELARRPEASSSESPELIAMRSERDAQSARIAELESAAAATAAAAATVDGDAKQERNDLQRRFEMAVDDVRQLKQENAQLRDKLAAAAKSGGGNANEPQAVGGDWAAQRARLMAMLEQEDESGSIAPERAAERATVSKTIAATDRVIANKDQEIAELRAALEDHAPGGVADQEAAALRDKLIDGDELIAVERQRLAKLSAEWEDKLRAAELEFSVERAKLAREQAALRERMLEIESGAGATPAGPAADHSKPRRRWLSALGLQEEDEGKKK